MKSVILSKSKDNKMRGFILEKVVLNIGGTEEKLDKGFILLKEISGKTPIKIKATKRIPSWKVRPGLEVGTKVTLRGQKALDIIRKLLPAVDNTLKENQIQDNFFSFGIHEYIEIPGMNYIREVGIMGLEVTAVFSKYGKSIENKKVKRGRAKRIKVTKEQIEDYIINEFGTEILRKKTHSLEGDN